MNDDTTAAERPDEGERPARRVRLPGFVSDEDIGLGDIVTRVTSSIGIRPCGGCAERAKRLNAWMRFSPKR